MNVRAAVLIFTVLIFSAGRLAALPGDFNANGFVDANDIRRLTGYLTGQNPLSAEELVLAELNADGVVDIADLIQIADCVSIPGFLGQLKTGQQISSAPFDDGFYFPTVGIPHQYTVNGDGTITDLATGLTWMQDPIAAGFINPLSWEDAIATAEALVFAGFSDWRLPTPDELIGLIDVSRMNPAIDTALFPTLPEYYWTILPDALNDLAAWAVNFESGYALRWPKSNLFLLRPVRSCATPGNPGPPIDFLDERFTLSANGRMVYDRFTDLVWLRNPADAGLGGEFNWPAAINNCENLVFDGFSNWRLPNRNELLSLIDYFKTSQPPIDQAFFVSETAPYWTATSVGELGQIEDKLRYPIGDGPELAGPGSANAWTLTFFDGTVFSNNKSIQRFIRPVRNRIGILNVQPLFVDLGTNLNGGQFSVFNVGDDDLAWTAAENPDQTWLELFSEADPGVPVNTVDGLNNQVVAFTIDRADLANQENDERAGREEDGRGGQEGLVSAGRSQPPTLQSGSRALSRRTNPDGRISAGRSQPPTLLGPATVQTNVDVTDNLGNTQTVTISVTLDAVLAVFPLAPINFSGNVTNQNVTVFNAASLGTLNWFVRESPPVSWLRVSSASGNTDNPQATYGGVGNNEVLDVAADRTGLPIGVYNTNLIFSSINNEAILIPVTFTVGGAMLNVNPQTLNFGNQTPSLTFNISNTGTDPLTWTATENGPFQTNAQELVFGGQSSNVNGAISDSLAGGETDVVTVNVDRSRLPLGANVETALITASTGANATVTFNIDVTSILRVNPLVLDFRTSDTILPLEIFNDGFGDMNWRLVENPEQLWFDALFNDELSYIPDDTSIYDSDPAIATDDQGNFVAVWVADLDGNGALHSAASLGNGGTSWTFQQEFAAPLTFVELRPDLATDEAGSWVAVWGALINVNSDYEIYFSRSTDNGATWSAAAVLNSDFAADVTNDFTPKIAHDGNGNLVVVWARQTAGIEHVISFSRSTDGGQNWSAPAVLSNTGTEFTGSAPLPDLAGDGGGKLMAVWNSDENPGGSGGMDLDIVFSFSIDGGQFWSIAEQVNDDGDNDFFPAVAGDGNGGWIIIWDESDQFSVPAYVATTDDGANWTSPPLLLFNDSSFRGVSRTKLVTDGNAWLAIWESDPADEGRGLIDFGDDIDLAYSVSTNLGQTWSEPLELNHYGTLDQNFTSSSNADIHPDAVVDSAGNWVAVWSTDLAVNGLDFDRDVLFSTSATGGTSWSLAAVLNRETGSGELSDSIPTMGMSAMSVLVDRAGIPNGDYEGELLIENLTDGGTTTVQVLMSSAFPIVGVNPNRLDFGSTEPLLMFNIVNEGRGTLNWTLTNRFNDPWFIASSAQGDTATTNSFSGTGNETITVTVDRTNLSFGTNGFIDVSDGNRTVEVIIFIDVLPLLSVVPNVISFDPGVTSGTFDILNIGPPNSFMPWTLTEIAGPTDNTPLQNFWLRAQDPQGNNTSSQDSFSSNGNTSITLTLEMLPSTNVLVTEYLEIDAALNNGGVELVQVNLDMRPAFDLDVYVIDLGTTLGMVGLEGVRVIENVGRSTLNWGYTEVPSTDTVQISLSVSPFTDEGDSFTTGVLNPGEEQDLFFRVDRTGLPPGLTDVEVLYTLHNFDNPSSDGLVRVLYSTGGPPMPRTNPTSFETSTSAATSFTLQLLNDGGGTFDWTLSETPPELWLIAAADSNPTSLTTETTDAVLLHDLFPALAFDPLNDVWVAVWNFAIETAGAGVRHSEVRYSRSTDGGETWSERRTLYTNPVQSDVPFKADIAVNGAGTFLVAFNADADGSGLSANDDIFVYRSIDGGQTFAPVAVAPPSTGTTELEPALIATTGLNWMIAWEASIVNGFVPNDFDVVYSLSSDDGLTWGATNQIYPLALGPDGNDHNVDLAYDGMIQVCAVWDSTQDIFGTIDAGIDEDIIFASYDTLMGTWSAAAPLSNLATTDDADADLDHHPSIAYEPSTGTFVTVWQSNTDFVVIPGPIPITSGTDEDILIARSTDTLTWSMTALLEPGVGEMLMLDSDDLTPSIAADTAGNLITVYTRSLGGTSMRAGASADGGQTWNGIILANLVGTGLTPADFNPRVAVDPDSGTWIGCWHSGSDYFNQGTAADAFYARTLDLGVTWQEPNLLNVEPGANRFSSTGPDDITVELNPGALPIGTYATALTITTDAGAPLVIPVTMHRE